MLSVYNLSVTFTMYNQGLTQRRLTVITELDLEVKAGEVMAVVGASGSGKSLLAHAILGILPKNAEVAGQIYFKGELLTPARSQTWRGREIALIPQSVGYLDPLMRVGSQVGRAAQLSGISTQAAKPAVEQTFNRYGLASVVKRFFPFQLSGGMARRVLVSTAAVGQAELVIADEPTPGLHSEVVRETLNHLRELANEGKGVILITHDIEAALQVADRVAVFYAGTTVEIADAQDFPTGKIRHPYTRALWRSLPQNDFIPVPGTQPSPDALPPGCLFTERCPWVTDACREARPAFREVRGAPVRCIHADEVH
ncbi:MAG: ABC transporter ATP-binding protein [Kastovskya adunca ATA6-11-RM4]|jgi:peptide/nickel transport system ATP-binding protein|nr:ABC transporter ATP-binding protein [Kastovskya adunca ATA6-11-RM4]